MSVFTRLPVHVQEQIAEQLKLDDLINLCQSSAVVASALKRANITLPKNVTFVEIRYINEEINVCFHTTKFKGEVGWSRASELPALQFVDKKVLIVGVLTESYCVALTAFFRRAGAKNMSLSLFYIEEDSKWCCSFAAFTELLKAADAVELRRRREIPPHILCNLPDKITKIEVFSPVNDEDLKKIRVPTWEIYDSQIGNAGLNNLLKEWFAGKRTIERIALDTSKELDAGLILNGIDFEETEDPKLFILENGDQRLYCRMDSECFYANTERNKV